MDSILFPSDLDRGYFVGVTSFAAQVGALGHFLAKVHNLAHYHKDMAADKQRVTLTADRISDYSFLFLMERKYDHEEMHDWKCYQEDHPGVTIFNVPPEDRAKFGWRQVTAGALYHETRIVNTNNDVEHVWVTHT